MNKKVLKEGLDFHDMKGQIQPKVTVDEYAAKMGKDRDIVTITFITNSKLAANDLVSWLEIGYDFVLDASVSTGEVKPGQWLVFVEMNRRTNVPNRIIEILEDLKTLTDIDLEDYKIEIDNKTYKADEDVLKNVIVTSPYEYKKKVEGDDELNEMRKIANLDNKNVYETIDDEIRKYIQNAGL